MAKVITTVLKFPADQTQKILEREDARPLVNYISKSSLCKRLGCKNKELETFF